MGAVRMSGAAGAAGRALVALTAAALLGGVGAVALAGTSGSDAGRWVLGLLCLGTVVSLAVAGRLCSGHLRRAWWLLATAAAVGGVLESGLVDAGVALWVLRPVAAALAVAALLSFPGTARTTRQWALLALDGWLLSGSLFVLLWIVSLDQRGTTDLLRGDVAWTLWILVDLVIASVVLALTLRLPRRSAYGALVLGFGAVMLCAAELVEALFQSTTEASPAYVACWTASFVAFASAPWVERSPFARAHDGNGSRHVVRIPYVVACVAIALVLVALASGRSGGGILVLVVVALLVSVVSSQALLSAENRRLVVQLSHQAELFRDRATRDTLTGLPNREVFTGRVELALTGPTRGAVAVLFVDLDGFKDVNDSFGHAIGDELLVEAAGRLAAEVRETDVVARFGGDEFVAMLADCSDEMALDIAERLRRSLSEPYRIGHRDVVVSASIGLARTDGNDDAESAMRNADLALYRAKESGRDRVSVYEPAMHATALRRLDAASRLRQALVHDRLALAFQPICDLRTGAVHSVEALLRFDQQDLADWTVTEVIAAAEESGLIVPLGGWVLDAAVSTLGAWLANGVETRMHVNVSSRQLESGDFARQVENALVCYGVPAAGLCLEITEHHLVRDLDSSARELEALRHLGVRVALDDFGTGYSSLSYLPRLPLDTLKVDRELIARVGTARDTVPAVLRLGRDLGLTVIAEGIERVEQLLLLRSSGCHLGQGHLLARPAGRRTAAEIVRRGYVDLPVEPIFAPAIAVSGSQTTDLTI